MALTGRCRFIQPNVPLTCWHCSRCRSKAGMIGVAWKVAKLYDHGLRSYGLHSYAGMAYIVMAHAVVADKVGAAWTVPHLSKYGRSSYGLHSYGLYGSGRYDWRHDWRVAHGMPTTMHSSLGKRCKKSATISPSCVPGFGLAGLVHAHI